MPTGFHVPAESKAESKIRPPIRAVLARLSAFREECKEHDSVQRSSEVKVSLESHLHTIDRLMNEQGA